MQYFGTFDLHGTSTFCFVYLLFFFSSVSLSMVFLFAKKMKYLWNSPPPLPPYQNIEYLKLKRISVMVELMQRVGREWSVL